MPMGSNSSKNGGGGNGGNIKGSIRSDAVKQNSKNNDSKLK